jgi:lipopolysaccharide transport system ATP-binding protein
MKNLAIKAENISKQYRLGEVGTGTLSHDLNRFWHKIRGNEDPYLQIGEANDRVTKGQSDYVWSLRDINFEIEQGDAVGIIGRNGAGKSTLLKLLSKVTKPTKGNFKVNGRIASLLEVGTGFNPEMTGRENIYLNGAILGMRRHEITRKLDEIIDFSGVERYIDTPVKRYSSGMYVRLAFAVAAHLESEILIVDEVLAVGDAEFQKKCLGKMGDVSKGEGRTVLFVSHNIAAVKGLCTKGIELEQGSIKSKGIINEVVDSYLRLNQQEENGHLFIEKNTLNREITITEAYIRIDEMNVLEYVNGSKFEIFWNLFCAKDCEFSIEILIKDRDKLPVLFSPTGLMNGWKSKAKSGEKIKISTELKLPVLASGVYYIDLMLVISGKKFIHYAEDALSFKVQENYFLNTGWNFMQSRGQGSILLNTKINLFVPIEI